MRCVMLATLVLLIPGSAGASETARVFAVTGDVINRGSDLYNQQDYPAAYHLFLGSLLTLKPMLDGKPELQKAIEDALAEAALLPQVRQRAYRLSEALHAVRGALRPAVSEEEVPALWLRLGEEKGIAQLAADWVQLASTDGKVNLVRGGRVPLDADAQAGLRKFLLLQASALLGGKLPPPARGLKEACQDLEVTDEEFDAGVAVLRKVLQQNGVKPADAEDLVRVIEAVRGEVVEAR